MASGLLGRLGESWDRFWFKEGSPAALGLFRILFAYALWREIETTRSKSIFAIEGGYHLPYFDWLPLVSLETYQWLHDLQFPLVLLIGLGLWMRPACATLLCLQSYVFFTDHLNFRNHPYFFMLVLLMLLLSPADEAFSVRRWWKRRRGLAPPVPPPQPLTWQRLIQVQVCIVYVYSAIQKMNPAFVSGEVLSHHLSGSLDEPGWEWALPFVEEPENLVAFAVLTILLELFLPFALWYRRTRLPVIAAGILFHASIAVTMNIRTFSIATICTYLLFLDPDRTAEKLAGLRSFFWRSERASS